VTGALDRGGVLVLTGTPCRGMGDDLVISRGERYPDSRCSRTLRSKRDSGWPAAARASISERVVLFTRQIERQAPLRGAR
jgi:hypothetical protein